MLDRASTFCLLFSFRFHIDERSDHKVAGAAQFLTPPVSSSWGGPTWYTDFVIWKDPVDRRVEPCYTISSNLFGQSKVLETCRGMLAIQELSRVCDGLIDFDYSSLKRS